MSQKNLSWVEAFNEAMNRDIQPKNTELDVAFFVREPSKEEVDEILMELEQLEVEVVKR